MEVRYLLNKRELQIKILVNEHLTWRNAYMSIAEVHIFNSDQTKEISFIVPCLEENEILDYSIIEGWKIKNKD